MTLFQADETTFLNLDRVAIIRLHADGNVLFYSETGTIIEELTVETGKVWRRLRILITGDTGQRAAAMVVKPG